MKKQDRWYIKIMDVAYKNYGRVMKSCENHFVFVCVVSLFCFVCLELPRRESWKRNQFSEVPRSRGRNCYRTIPDPGGNREASASKRVETFRICEQKLTDSLQLWTRRYLETNIFFAWMPHGCHMDVTWMLFAFSIFPN